MAKRVLVALLAIAAATAWLTFQEEGDEAFGGIAKPLESVRGEGLPHTDWLTGFQVGSPDPHAAQTD